MAAGLIQIFLDEPGAEVDVELDKRGVAIALDPMDLAGLDDKVVARASFEFPSVDDPEAASFPDEMYLVVRMPMESRTSAGKYIEEKDENFDVAVVSPDELVRTALEGKVLVTNMINRLGFRRKRAVRLGPGSPVPAFPAATGCGK